MGNESKKRGRTEVLDDSVCRGKLIGFPKTIPISTGGDL